MGVTWTQLKSFLKVLVSWIPMATPPNTVRYKMNSGNRFFICRNCRNHLVTWNNCRGRFLIVFVQEKNDRMEAHRLSKKTGGKRISLPRCVRYLSHYIPLSSKILYILQFSLLWFLGICSVNVRTDPISTHRFLFNLPVVKVRCNRCNMRLGQQFVSSFYFGSFDDLSEWLYVFNTDIAVFSLQKFFTSI
ncbi:hypothetical protein Gogos_019543, partial [Gossypium gossypioides]|nr:hypothetical protein [Gossypium gossypioides]